ncbi:MAG TPA: hypothetical protein EYP56_15685 [Planctomycetaceae bacterium]|nr:hypothetical protein [Planctomycetaceae bacterium]HIQ23053.1 hypothetical protein [Planctomycetota bacterium]
MKDGVVSAYRAPQPLTSRPAPGQPFPSSGSRPGCPAPPQLRDHGCEIIGGPGLLAAVESEMVRPMAAEYLARLEEIFDQILARGTNPNGLMYNAPGNPKSGLSDGWGYNYVGCLCYDMATGRQRYGAPQRRSLANLLKPACRDYPWEGRSVDGLADSIEGAIYLLNRVPVPEARRWVDQKMAKPVVRSDEPLKAATLRGTMKPGSNGVRTVIMNALMFYPRRGGPPLAP